MTDPRQLLEDIDDFLSQIAYAQEAIRRGDNVEVNQKIVEINQPLLEHAQAQAAAELDAGLAAIGGKHE